MNLDPLLWLTTYRMEILGVMFALIVAEILYVYWKLDSAYTSKEALTNVAILVIGQGSRKLTYGFRLAVFVLLYDLSPLRIETTVGSIAVCYLGLDLLYYAKHRWVHETALGWSIHAIHHSSTELNLTTSVRSGWIQRFIDDFFYSPLVLLGFSPVVVLLIADINLFSQFWVHTRVKVRLGFLEGIINTPSAHRVHHAADRKYSDSNYGSTLMIWDRLFGTYRPEPKDHELRYGIEGSSWGQNPVKIQFGPLVDYWRSLWATKETKERPSKNETKAPPTIEPTKSKTPDYTKTNE
jgi:sterol desaturase/sphingolipid hydroxylase (fatty acid hydroxylase superfamily)